MASIRGGLIACLFGKSPKQTSAIVIRVDGMLGFLSEEFRRNFASLLSRSNGAGTRLLLLTIQGRLCALLPISILSPDGLAATANCVLTPAERPNAALLSPLMLKNRASAPMALLSSLSVLLIAHQHLRIKNGLGIRNLLQASAGAATRRHCTNIWHCEPVGVFRRKSIRAAIDADANLMC